LLIRDDLIGVFSIESRCPRSFGEHDRDLVSIIANQIASAIRNAQLYEQRRLDAAALQEANVSLEARVAERNRGARTRVARRTGAPHEARSRVEGPLLGGSALVRELRDAVARQANPSNRC
jgi:GAF domain-containing protein